MWMSRLGPPPLVVCNPAEERKLCVQRVVQPFVSGPEFGSMPLGHRDRNTVIELLIMFLGDFEGTKEDAFGRTEESERKGENLCDCLPCCLAGYSITAPRLEERAGDFDGQLV